MEKKKTVNDTYEKLKEVKLGLLKLSYVAAVRGQTVESGNLKYSVSDYSKKLASDIDTLKDDVDTAATKVNALLNKTPEGPFLRKALMHLDSLQQGLLKVSDAAEKGKTTILQNDKLFTLQEYENKLIKDTDSTIEGIRLDVSQLETDLGKKLMNNATEALRIISVK